MRPWSRSLLPLFAAALGLLSCNACYDVDQALAYPCDPDAGREADGGFLDGGMLRLDDGGWQDAQCHEGFRCGLEGRCHPTGPDAGAAWRCVNDSWCEADWRCGPDGVCVDARQELLPALDAGAAAPLARVAPGDWSGAPAFVSASTGSTARVADRCGHAEPAFGLSWVEGGELRKAVFAHAPDRVPAWSDGACDAGGGPQDPAYDTGRARIPLTEAPVQLLDLGPDTVALLDGGAVVCWAWRGQGALGPAVALPVHPGFAPGALRADSTRTCLAGFDDGTLAFWRLPPDGGSWQLGDRVPLPQPRPLEVAVWPANPSAGSCLAAVAWPRTLLNLVPACDGGSAPCLADLSGPGEQCLPAGSTVAGLRVHVARDTSGSPRPVVAVLLWTDAGVTDWRRLPEFPESRQCTSPESLQCPAGVLDVRGFVEANTLEVVSSSLRTEFHGTVQRCAAPDGGSAQAVRSYANGGNDLFPPLSDSAGWARPGVRARPEGSLGGFELDDHGGAWFERDDVLAPVPAFPDRAPAGVAGTAARPVAVVADAISSPQVGTSGGLYTWSADAGWSRSSSAAELGLLVGTVSAEPLVLRRLYGALGGLMGPLWVTTTATEWPGDLRLAARLMDPDLARGPFLAATVQAGASRRLVVAAFDTLTSAPQTAGLRLQAGSAALLFQAPTLEPQLVLAGRSPITSLAARDSAPDAGVGDAQLLAAADGRLFQVSLGEGDRGWSAIEVPLPGPPPASVWFDRGVGRVGQADGTVRSLPSRLALSPPLPPAPGAEPGFAAACGHTFATWDGRLYELMTAPGAVVGAWSEVPLPGRTEPVERAFALRDGVLVFDARAGMWRLTWEGCR